jgi:hypothetical protein
MGTKLRQLLCIILLLTFSQARGTTWGMDIDLGLDDSNSLKVCVRRFQGDENGVPLTSVTLYPSEAKAATMPLWSLNTDGVVPKLVKCFRYGEQVGGLHERIAPSALEVDKVYQLFIRAPGHIGHKRFRIDREPDGKKVLKLLSP